MNVARPFKAGDDVRAQCPRRASDGLNVARPFKAGDDVRGHFLVALATNESGA
jgi:hypothetical protein